MATCIVPINDIESHEDYSTTCKCDPAVEFREDGEMVIIHNSFDKREERENGKQHEK